MEGKQKRGLRRGYTTGTCAAAAAKAAAIAFFTGRKIKEVQIILPAGEAVTLPVCRCEIGKDAATASVIKDAGDDPDVTNGAEIIAEIQGQGPRVKGQGDKAFQFTVYSSRFTNHDLRRQGDRHCHKAGVSHSCRRACNQSGSAKNDRRISERCCWVFKLRTPNSKLRTLSYPLCPQW